MDQMVFVRTFALPEQGKVRANLANTRLKRGSHERGYKPSLSPYENHLVAARCWIIDKMHMVNNQPIGCQSFDNGYIFAFSAD